MIADLGLNAEIPLCRPAGIDQELSYDPVADVPVTVPVAGRAPVHGPKARFRNRGGFPPDSPSLTSRIRIAGKIFPKRKRLICKAGLLPNGAKVAVVKTYPVPKAAPVCIIGSRYVPALHDAKERRQGASLLQSG